MLIHDENSIFVLVPYLVLNAKLVRQVSYVKRLEKVCAMNLWSLRK